MTLHNAIPLAKNDAVFRRWLLESPEAALVQAGIDVPAEMTVEVLENTPENATIVLPLPPEGALSEEALGFAKGGVAKSTCGSWTCCYSERSIPSS